MMGHGQDKTEFLQILKHCINNRQIASGPIKYFHLNRLLKQIKGVLTGWLYFLVVM
jgi:hypothetical protein